MSRSPLSEAIAESAHSLLSIGQFWRTRRAVRSGLELHKLDDAERELNGFASPWPFCIQEVVFAAIPSFLLVGMLNLLFGEVTSEVASPNASGAPVAQQLFERIFGWLDNLTVPALLTLAVYLVSWGALKAKDSTPEARRKCREAYLYLNGAYGMTPQAILTTAVAYLAWQYERSDAWLGSSIGLMVHQVVIVAVLVSSVWILWQLGKAIPKRLFAAFGYTDRAGHFWQKARDDDPPWSRYSTAVFLGGWPLALLWNAFVLALAGGITELLMVVRASLLSP